MSSIRSFSRWVVFLAVGASLPPPDVRSDDGFRQDREKAFQSDIRPLIAKYCFDCHSEEVAEGAVDLESFSSAAEVLRGQRTWLRVVQKLRQDEMPPPDAARPSQAERRSLASALEDLIHGIDCAEDAQPGRVTIRRLSRTEYRYTVRDLLGVDYRLADDFPADDVGYGFDNIADVLSLPPILLEKYVAAAEEVSRQALLAEASAPESGQRGFSAGTGGAVSSEEAARGVLERLASRAYRRPITEQELTRLLRLVQVARDQGDSYEQSIQLALQAILVAPQFLYRIERDPPPGVAERALDDFELATRLSYFLWSSMPDEKLFDLARRGMLRQGENLRRQVRRMLDSPKSQALVDHFAAQWLELRKFDEVEISQRDFPSFDERLRADMRLETTLFVEHILREDRSVVELLSADYTFLNERLAQHYGVSGVKGEQFRRVVLTGSPRGGLLTQGSLLTVTSNPTRTSPVKRGRWILENLLGEPPPSPPANVPPLSEDPQAKSSGTLRQRLEQHRRDPSCASCHESMDALGLALENFDAVGAWRDSEAGYAIDASGELPGGERFNGPRELARVIAETKRSQFIRCLAEKLLTYALGRGLEYYDRCAVDEIVRAAGHDEHRFSSLIWGIVSSEPFQKRGDKPAGR